VKYTAPEISNALLIGFGTKSYGTPLAGLGKAFYIGNIHPHPNPTPSGTNNMPGYDVELGNEHSGTAIWASQGIPLLLSKYQLKKDGKLLEPSDLPDYSVSGAAGKHYIFSVNCTTPSQ
jgi:hypothetical protein